MLSRLFDAGWGLPTIVVMGIITLPKLVKMSQRLC
jgi:hypothetical protein